MKALNRPKPATTKGVHLSAELGQKVTDEKKAEEEKENTHIISRAKSGEGRNSEKRSITSDL